MRAAVVRELGASPKPDEVHDLAPTDGKVLVSVRTAGLNPIDQHFASGRYGNQPVPHVIGREGIGTTPDGQRVYFSAGPLPSGSVAEAALAAEAALFPVPDALSDGIAIALGAAGLAAWMTLVDQADLQSGEKVLVLGASGVVGQLAAQAARSLGASLVVGAARNTAAAAKAKADVVVELGDDAPAALKDASDGGFNVVIDPIGGQPLADAALATADGARIVTFGVGAGDVAPIQTRALQGRRLIGHSARFFGNDRKREAYGELTELALAGDLDVDVETYKLDDVAWAWDAQSASPGRKLVIELA
jgi:NADPH2:quinone reductase